MASGCEMQESAAGALLLSRVGFAELACGDIKATRGDNKSNRAREGFGV